MTNGLTTPWISLRSEIAQDFLRRYIRRKTECELVSELQSRGSRNAEEINAWLIERGFSIQLPKGSSGDLYLAAIMQIALEWTYVGKKTSIYRDEVQYRAVRLGKEACQTVYSDRWPADRYVTRIPAKNGDTAYLHIPEKAPATEWQLISAVMEITNDLRAPDSKNRVSTEYLGAIFPEVDLNIEPDVSWLEGVSAHGNDGLPLVVACCKEQVKIKIDEKGASVGAAAAMLMSRGSGPVPMYFDQPFLFWVERPGMTDPLVAAWINPDCWLKT
jgi:hypothetical protein